MYAADTPPYAPPAPAGAAVARQLVPEQRSGHAPGLALSGELDVADVPRLEARLDELVDEGARELLVDASGVTFMDLRTLRVLLRTDRRLRARGGRLRLTAPSRPVRRLLAVTATEHLAR